jgi:hypothetical protein
MWRVIVGGLAIGVPVYVSVTVWSLLGLMVPLTMWRDTALAVYNAEIQLLVLLGALTPIVTGFGGYLKPEKISVRITAALSIIFVFLSGFGVALCVCEMIWERFDTYSVFLPLLIGLFEMAGLLEYMLGFTGVLDPVVIWMLKD